MSVLWINFLLVFSYDWVFYLLSLKLKLYCVSDLILQLFCLLHLQVIHYCHSCFSYIYILEGKKKKYFFLYLMLNILSIRFDIDKCLFQTHLLTQSPVCTCPPPWAALCCRRGPGSLGHSCRFSGCVSGLVYNRWAPEWSTVCGRSDRNLQGDTWNL